MENIKKAVFKIGKVLFECEMQADFLTGLRIVENSVEEKEEIPEAFKEVKDFLCNYIEGKKSDYKGQIRLIGTENQKKVIKECMKIKYGEIISYKELAEKAGIKNGARFVGNVMAGNKLIIIVPCHRVVPFEYYKNNELIGNYGPGKEYKKLFLKLERGE